MTDEQGTDEQQEESRPESGGDDEVSKARKAAEEEEQAKKKVKELEEDPPEKLEDWPDDKAKYETFGGAEGNESYEESVTSKLGPSSLRFKEDGGVVIEGEEVDDPDKYKGEPIPGGPTDEDAPQDLTTQKIREDQGRELESEKGDEESGESKSDSDDDDSDDDSGEESSQGG
ncbi:MAG: hypothetical protein QOI98_1711 [Solirubrobacteraceae bacterium]|nr:hypothetical protein [Solirubrobacteraceae bacterium]